MSAPRFVDLLAAVVALASLCTAQDLRVVKRDSLDPVFRRAIEDHTLVKLGNGLATPASLDVDTAAFEIPTNTFLVAREMVPAPRVVQAGTLLPIHLGVVNPSNGNADSTVAVLQPKVASSGIFIPTGSGYQAEIIVSLAATGADANVALPRSVTFAIAVVGGRADPFTVKFDAVGQAERVLLSIPAYREKVDVTVSLVGSTIDEVKLAFGAQHGSLSVSVTPEEILGYGLGVATVIIQGDGLMPIGTSVNLRTDKGYVDPVRVKLDDERGATTMLRSDGSGDAVVHASTGDSGEEAEFKVRFLAPWKFLTFALFGGLAGTAVRVFKKKNRSWLRGLLVGALAGFISAILWALGIRVLTLEFSASTSEFAAFGISALVGVGLGSIWQPK